MDNPSSDRFVARINELVAELRVLQPGREVSIAITHLQTAALWMNEASVDTPQTLSN